MSKRYKGELSAKELAALGDNEIDFSDIPEMPDTFWENATLVYPDKTKAITIRVKESVVEAFKREGKGYQTRMNAVLESYAKSQLTPPSSEAE